jgi:O-antigen/teichoic acid export membrane protein
MFRLSLAGAGRVVSFGMTSSAVTLLNMFYEMLPRLAFGKMLGFDAVGLYGRAQTVCQLPDRAIGSALQPVVLPAMAALARSGRDLKPAYLRGLSLMTAVQWPALILLALLADPAVRVLLGPQWDAAAPLVRLIALGNLALAPALMTFPVLVSAGRIRDTLFASLISLPPSAAILIGSASFGLTAVATSVLITAPLQMAVALLFIRRAIGVGWGEFFGAMWSSAVVACATAAAPITVILASPDGFDLSWPAAALAATGGGAGWLAAILLTGHPAAAEIGAVRTIAGSLLRATRPAPDPSCPISERSAP